MCKHNCCSKRSPIAKILAARRLLELEEEERQKSHLIITTPQSLLYEFPVVEAMAEYIINVSHIRPKYGIICGTFLSSITSLVEDPVSILFEDIPDFPIRHTPESCLILGHVMGAPVIAMSDRFHNYDGYELATCSLPVRVMKLCGVKTIMLTCSAAGVNPRYNLGDIMLINDHINMVGLMQNSPLDGPLDPRFGNRFLPMINAYDAGLLKMGLEIGKSLGLDKALHSGVYACLGGPVHHTLAEERLLCYLQADVVGMSLIPEVIAAHHSGMRIFAFAIVTAAAMENYETEEGEDVKKEPVPQQRMQACIDMIGRLIYYIHNDL